jgi:hypothetical protein
MTSSPKWLPLGEEIATTAIDEALSVTNYLRFPNLQVKPIPYMAVCHLHACFSLSIDSNKRGWHSAAICLLRQCVEAVTVMDIGLQDTSYSEPLLLGWAEGRRSHGELRKRLEEDVWPSYGTGLWDEPWSKYFANLAKAVQPYAHYSPELQGWQWVNVKQLSNRSFILGMGPETYDELKACRIALLHALTGWTIARTLLATNRSRPINQREHQITELGNALARSKLLFKSADWATQLMPHMWFKRGHSYRDE